MANVLLVVGDIGPAEGSIYRDLRNNGHRVIIYNISGRWVPRDENVPLWMGGATTRLSPLARNWFTRAVESAGIEFTISSGLSAAAFAANNLGGDFYPLLWRGNLNFGAQNRVLSEEFAELIRTSSRLLLEDPWEMDKAVAANSQIPHFRMRYPAAPERHYLASTSGNVAIIYRRTNSGAAQVLRSAAQEAFGDTRDVGLVEIKSIYNAKDLEAGRDLYENLARRLRNYSYAIVLGTGPHHSTVVRALARDRDRIVLDQTVGMAYLSEDMNLPHRARGLRCVQEMKQVIETNGDIKPWEQQPAYTSREQDYLVTLHELWQKEVSADFEELPAVDGEGPLDIFFSVGTVQDVKQGARHQRVRNMHDAFSQYSAMNIYGAPPFFNRRLKLTRRLLQETRPAGVFYGENSTAPMTKTLSSQLATFLEEFGQLGGRSMWFVRDLHWLETYENSPWSEQRTAELRTDGLYELNEIGDRVDILAAPSPSAGEGYNRLVTTVNEAPRDWYPLPPAVHPHNIVDDSQLIKREGVTLLYTGGINEVYGMRLYLSVLKLLDSSILADFVVREPEALPLMQELERLDLLSSERIRILHTTMDLYRPRTSRTLGTILLDSAYAKLSFPYKTATMIERGYPILCYSDMGIADFVVSNHLGVAVERNADSVQHGIKTLISEHPSGIANARQIENWHNRAKEVYQALSRERLPLESE